MAVEDAVAAALLVTISGTLTVLAVAAFWRYRNPSFVLLTAAFLVALTEGIVISLLVLGLLPGSNMPIFLVAGGQGLGLVLIYAANFPREAGGRGPRDRHPGPQCGRQTREAWHSHGRDPTYHRQPAARSP